MLPAEQVEDLLQPVERNGISVDSGSTEGVVIEAILDAAVALLEASRRLGTTVALVVFGSNIVARVEPGREYDRIATLLASLRGQSGGTQLAPALSEAFRFRPPDGRRMGTVIFTDSYVNDVEASLPRFQELSRAGPVVFFCVEEHLDESTLEPVRQVRPPIRVVRHRPGVPLVGDALEILDAPPPLHHRLLYAPHRWTWGRRGNVG